MPNSATKIETLAVLARLSWPSEGPPGVYVHVLEGIAPIAGDVLSQKTSL